MRAASLATSRGSGSTIDGPRRPSLLSFLVVVHRICAVSFAALALLLAAAPRALAQDGCDDPIQRGPQDITPAVGAAGVTLGAPIRVRYPEGYFEDPAIGADPLTMLDVMLEDTPWPGAIQVIGDTLVYIPSMPYEAGTEYSGVARGVDNDLEFRFRTGSTFDSGGPTIGAITAVNASRIEDATCELPEGGYRLDVELAPATDDGAPGDLEYFLFLTRGPEVDEPMLLTSQRNTPEMVVMAAPVPASAIAGPICIAVVVVDGVGETAETPPHCDDPVKGNFFAPLCSASAAGRPAPGSALVLLLPGLLALRARRRR
jgi:hypothetical protein